MRTLGALEAPGRAVLFACAIRGFAWAYTHLRLPRLNDTIPVVGEAAPTIGRPGLAAAVWRVRAVVPCFNRPADLQKLLLDLAAQDLGDPGRVRLSVLIVDNASSPPLEGALGIPPALDATFVRLERNTGGSGGFNAGMAYWLQRGIAGDACELLWLLDSDAGLEPGALRALLAALEARPDLAMVGSALADPETRSVFEVGGRVDFATGEYVQGMGTDGGGVVDVEYAAACSLLIRRGAVERAGLMADTFLNGDDVEWCYRVSRVTGLRVGVATDSRAIHPRPDRMRTGARYYAARNAARAIWEAGRTRPGRVGSAATVRKACGRRALREIGRGLAQAMVGRADLAELHIRGLEDAAAGQDLGPASRGRIDFEPAKPLSELPGELKRMLAAGVRGRVLVRPRVLEDAGAVTAALRSICYEPVVREGDAPGPVASGLRAIRRILAGREFGVAVVSARARPADWAVARVIVTVADGGFMVRELRRREAVRTLLSLAARGLRARRAIMARAGAGFAEAAVPLRTPPRPSVSVVILSYNRWEMLRVTLAQLRAIPMLRTAQVIVADNGSRDGTVEKLREEFADVEVLTLAENRGVAAFNEAANRARGEAVLILDDDAWPDQGALEAALGVLGARADIGGVALHPRHPDTRASEWPFAERVRGKDERWPVMGCGNLVRREAWERVGGYEESFFLYRNDTDLAMKLLGAGYGVYFDPALVVWHDSPAAARKSLRWFELATRNWIWLCRRHGRGWVLAAGALSGWGWAHRLAGRDARAHWHIVKGAVVGVLCRSPGLPDGCSRTGLRRLLALRLGR